VLCLRPSDEVKKVSLLFPLSHPLWHHLLYPMLWILFAIPILLLPMNYGKMVKSNFFFKVRLIKQVEETSSMKRNLTNQPQLQYEGWLLREDSQKIVLYSRVSVEEPILIFKRDEFVQIQILGYENVFSGR
jgi:hypothetical protein